MKFEEIDYVGVIESHYKIFVYLAQKYIQSFKGLDVEDLIQEQKIACYQAIPKIDTTKPIGSFLYTVAENRIKSLYRYESRKKRKPKQLLYLESGSFEYVGLLLKSPEPSVEELYYAAEIKQKATDVAKEILSDFEYELYLMIVEEGKNKHQIAEAIGKSESQVANGISRMHRKMRKKRALIDAEV